MSTTPGVHVVELKRVGRIGRPTGLLHLTLASVLVAAGTAALLSTSLQTASAAPSAAQCAIPAPAFVNPGFESPSIGAGNNTQVNAANTTPAATGIGWSTNDSQGRIELWGTGFQSVPSDSGSQFAELDANTAGTIWQDIPTTPGTVIEWSFAHRGRSGTDVMQFEAGSPTGGTNAAPITTPTVLQSAADGPTAWGHYASTTTTSYTVPAGQTTTRFAFAYVSSSGGDASVGNFIDSLFISVDSNACADSYTALQGKTTTLPVLSNDQGNQLTASAPSADTNATVALTGTGVGNAFTYTPNPGFSGTDTFTYTATDIYGKTSTATVTVTVPPLPSAPNLTSSGTTPSAQTATFTLPSGSTAALIDANGKPQSSVPATDGSGTYTISGGSLTFTPASTFTGTAAAATYRVTDTYGQTASGTYTPTVKPVAPAVQNLTTTAVGPASQSVSPTVPAGGTLALVGGQTATTNTVANQGTYTLANGVITFTPLSSFVGTATPQTFTVTDSFGQSATDKYTPTETRPTKPGPSPLTTTGTGTAVQSITPTLPVNGSLQLLNGTTSVTSYTVANQGTYALSADKLSITFTPVLGFTGPATPATFQLTDGYNQTGTTTYTPTVKVPAGPTASPLTSNGVGTQVESATPATPAGGSFQLLAADGKTVVQSLPVTDANGKAEGTYGVASDGLSLIFTPVLGFFGTATAANYQLTDAYKTVSTPSTYTPTVSKPAAPTASALTSSDTGTNVQDATPAVPVGGSFQLLAADGTTVVTSLPATDANGNIEGTYSLSTDGTMILFTPVLGFSGVAAAANFRVTDAYGTPSIPSTYTPTVNKPAAPQSSSITTTGQNPNAQVANPTVPVNDTLQLLDGSGVPTTSLTVSGQGTYTLNGTTITFTPLSSFVGTATPASFRIVDSYGQRSANSTYTPKVTNPGAPTASPLVSSGPGQAVQTVTPTPPTGGSIRLLNADGSAATGPVTITAGQGVYNTSTDGKSLTFTPALGYTGTADPANYEVLDQFGQPSTPSTYTPSVTNPAPPIATPPLTSDGIGTQVQTASPQTPVGGSATLLSGPNGTPVTTLTVTDSTGHTGVYAKNAAGNFTFTPSLGYQGTGPAANYRLTDAYKQTADSTYTARTAAPTAPTPAPLTSSDTATAVQSVTPTIPANGSATLLDVNGSPTTSLPVNDASGKLAGTYAAGPNGTFTFTPATGFSGTAPAAAYRLTDAYNQSGTSTYTATVKKPTPPGPSNVSTEGTATAAQPVTIAIPAGGTIALTGGASTTSVTLDPSQGAYTLDPSTGLITFSPVLGFSGKATAVTFVVTDAYGQTGTATDTPTVDKPAPPPAANLTPKGVGTAPENVTATVPAGDTITLGSDGTKSVTSITVAEGVYTLDPTTNVITFTPNNGVQGAPTPIKYTITDAYKQSATGNVTPAVTAPAAPAPKPLASSGSGTNAQAVSAVIPTGGTLTLIDPTNNTATANPVTTAQGVYSVSGSVITFTPAYGYQGTPTTPIKYQVTDAYGGAGSSTYTPTVTPPGAPTPANVATSGPAPTAQSTNSATSPSAPIVVPAKGSLALLNANGTVATGPVTIAKQGSYTLGTDGTSVVFTPLSTFAGTATAVTFRVGDAYGQFGSAAYTPTVVPPTPPMPADVTTQGIGTAAESTTITPPTGGSVTLVDPAKPGTSPTSVTIDPTQGTYTISGSTITFTPVLGYVGTASPVTFQVTDIYGQSNTATDTPTVSAPTKPAPTAVVSSNTGTTPQTGTPNVPANDTILLLNPDGTVATGPVTIPTQGTYVLNTNNTITFTPVLGFQGPATPVRFQLTDPYKQTGVATYTPTVNPPGAPPVTPLTSQGKGTAPQTASVPVPTNGSVTLLDANNAPTSQPVVVPNQGTYTLTGTTITFTPVLGYTGTATPVGYQVKDSYGTPAASTYTPTVNNPAVPTASPVTSAGSGTDPEAATVTLPAGGSASLLDATGAAATQPVTLDPKQGTYTLSGSTITFTPVLGFKGVATPVKYTVTDAYKQTSASSTDTPTVSAPAGPAAKGLTSTGAGTAPQTASVTIPTNGSATLLDANGKPATSVTVPNQGTYTLSGATITFTPVNGYVGTATPVSYQVTDAYGTTASGPYTPTVTNPAGPTAGALTSEATGPSAQSANVTIPSGGSVTLLDASGKPATTVTVANQGTYTLSGATITFTPLSSFSGTATPVIYQVTDAYKQTQTAPYTPTEDKPAAAPAPALTSSGTATAPQTATVPLPSGDTVTLLDSTNQPTSSVTVTGQGTYTLSGTTITFAPINGFSGTATPVNYQITDPYKTTSTGTDTASVTKPAAPVAPALTSTGVGTQVQSVSAAKPAGGTIMLLGTNGQPTSQPVQILNEGTYTLSGSTITFTPVAGFNGTATPVGYRVTDAYGTPSDGTDTATVTKPTGPTAPDLTSDGKGVEPQSVTPLVPAGDTLTLVDANGDSATTVTLNPAQGTYSLANGVITFVPVAPYTTAVNGPAAALTYRITDPYGTAANGTYTPAVSAPQGPTAPNLSSTGTGAKAQSVSPGIPAGGSITLLDTNGNPTTKAVVTPDGTYTLAGGVITFTPTATFSGTAAPVQYTATDQYGTISTPGRYTPTVNLPGAPAPGAASTSGVGTAPQSTTVAVPAGDTIALDGGPTTVTVPKQGTFSLDPATGKITFTPLLGFAGTATVSFTETDVYGQTGTATYAAKVSAPAGPTAASISSSGVGTAPSSATPTVPAGGSVTLLDANNNPTTTVTFPNQGTYDLANGVITFTPVNGFSGAATPATYQITDAYGQTSSSTDTASASKPTGPTVKGTTLNGPAGSPVTGTVTATGSGPLAFSIGTAPTHGIVTIDPASGAVTYSADPGYTGPDTFTVIATDAYNTVSAPTSVGVASTPVAQPASVTAELNTPLSASVPTPVATAPTGYSIVTAPAHGAVTIKPDGSFVYTPAAGYVGGDSFTYSVTDASGQVSPPATITIAVGEGAAPVAQPDTGTTKEGVTLAGASVLANDVGATALTPTLVKGTSHGTVTLRSDGTYTYVPAAGFAGVDSFTYTVTDAFGRVSAPTTVTIAVSAVVPPTVTGGISQTITLGKGLAPIAATSPSGASTFKAGAGLPSGVSLTSTGAFSGKPNKTGTFTFPVTVTAPDGGVTVVTVKIVVKPVPVVAAAPVATNITVGDVLKLPNFGGTITKVTGTLPPGIKVDGESLVGTGTKPGKYVVTVTVNVRGKTVTRRVTITVNPKPPTQPGGHLAFTGAPVSALIGWALLLLTMGAGLVLFGAVRTRRRRRS